VHGGADAGYRTMIMVLPEVKMGFLVFSNLGNFDPGAKAQQMADLFIKDPSPKKEDEKPVYTDSTKAVLSDLTGISKFTGDYVSDDGIHFGYRLKNNKLYWLAPNGNPHLLIQAEKDTFVIFTQQDVKFVFGQMGKGQKVDEYWPDNARSLFNGNHRLLVKYDTTPKADKALLAYTGKYYSPELDCSYSIVLKDHHLVLTNAKYDDMPLKLYGENHLHDDFWWMDNLAILRNSKNKITGFEINSGRVMHVKFDKVE
jgi:hypothetical protein